MTKKQFKHDFLRGLGSAIIELQSGNHPEKYSDTVLYGCLHNTTYDMQIEGDRGWYLYYAAQLVGDYRTVESAVIKKFCQIKDDHWLFVQLTSILYRFASDGSEAARDALYCQYEKLLKELSLRKRKRNGTYPRCDMFDWLCVWLTSLDGWSAYKRIVRDVSEILLPQDNERFFSEWFYANSKMKFGEKRVDGYLRKQAGRSEIIRVYYEKAKAWDKSMYSGDRPIPTLEQVLAGANGQEFRSRCLAMCFAKNASPEELGELLQAALDESDEQIKNVLLWPFRKLDSFEFPEKFLMQLLESENEKLRDTAYVIIGQNPSHKSRELALSLIKSGEDVENGLFLLAKNMRPEDEALFFEAVITFPVHSDDWAWHSVFKAAQNGIKVMRGKPKTDILEYIFRHQLCSLCREGIVRVMHKKKMLTEEILRECLFDSNSDIRVFAERIIKSKRAYI